MTTEDSSTLRSCSPNTGEPVGRHPVTSADEVIDAVTLAGQTSARGSGLGFDERRRWLIHYKQRIVDGASEPADPVRAEPVTHTPTHCWKSCSRWNTSTRPRSTRKRSSAAARPVPDRCPSTKPRASSTCRWA